MTGAIAPLQAQFWRVCEALLMDHTNPWELDEALIAWGYRLGPCEAQDLVGLDVVLAVLGSNTTAILPRMVAEGRLGKKVGWGFYRYPGGGGAVVDPLIEDLIREEAWFAKHARVTVDDATLVGRLHAEMEDDLRADPAAAVDLLHFPVAKIGVL